MRKIRQKVRPYPAQKNMRKIRQRIRRYPAQEIMKLISKQTLLAKFHSYIKKGEKNRDFGGVAIMGLQIHSISEYPELAQIKESMEEIFEKLRTDVKQILITELNWRESQSQTKFNYYLDNIDNLEKSFLSLITASNILQICSGLLGIFRSFQPGAHNTYTNYQESLHQIEDYCRNNADDLKLSSHQIKEMKNIFEKHLNTRLQNLTNQRRKKQNKNLPEVPDTQMQNENGQWLNKHRAYEQQLLSKML